MDRVGIVGSGTMGIEIAQAAAEHGFKVILYDLTDEIVLGAIRRLKQRLHKKVEQGRYKAENMNLVMVNIHPVTSLIELNECDIVIEAVPESLALKQQIFEDLEKVCKPTTILATNTSSLSITAIAGKMKTAHRVVGCHFFNPASIIKLVEVIPGMMTDDVTVKTTIDFITSLHKEPVEAKDTPGFIVNRVARSFYGEALRLVDEGLVEIETLDRLAKTEAGFPMGPFELMDFIGIDVNYAVTESVYNATFSEPRYKPHLMQKRLVDSGMLGRKSSRGFYRYDTEQSNERVSVHESNDHEPSQRNLSEQQPISLVIGDGASFSKQWTDRLVATGQRVKALLWEKSTPEWNREAFSQRIKAIEELADLEEIRVVWLLSTSEKGVTMQLLQCIEKRIPSDAIIFTSALSVSATEQASWCQQSERLFGFGIVPTLIEHQTIEISKPLQASRLFTDKAKQWLYQAGISNEWIGDGPGLVMPRIIAMIINEAATAITERIASVDAIDKAMKLGTRYPYGPLEWADRIGIQQIYRILEGLYAEFGDDRYRPAPLLKRMMLAHKSFY